jgi:hypothetical protein
MSLLCRAMLAALVITMAARVLAAAPQSHQLGVELLSDMGSLAAGSTMTLAISMTPKRAGKALLEAL